MKLFHKKKNKASKMTLDDCLKFYQKNPQYRYVIVTMEERIPISFCETMKTEKELIECYWYSEMFPVEIVDLAFYEMEGKYAAKRL